ncbi:hypothetical protein FD07_GL000927 [Levilactobacillus parabrevis ATCC 53295]|uniref:WxL domain-containing protein n=1 Tax=Levilactobacillus parabrevis ATCC 53295 TaxID=1267003 RepID=A0A0R1GQG2_9LACO|nr:hypothetical protein FD07_GL000927 [Levilactobacillus parabrevis ATCC 53295]KRO05668.1 hypothetical protein IV61_GL001024 [Levilactobacillus parabrevis]
MSRKWRMGLTRVAPRVLPDEGRVKGVLMMKLRSKMLTVAGTVLAGIGLGVFWNTVVGEAFTTSIDSIMSSEPKGLHVNDQNYFTIQTKIGNPESATTIPNAAKIQDGPNGDAVQVSSLGQQNSGGAIWSKGKTFDMYQNQRASMWVYVNGGDVNDKPGEGMAFAIQNSSDSAFSGTGESLGVWGVDPKSNDNTIAQTAIQHSWAIEFDTRLNQTMPASNLIIADTTADAFDIGTVDDITGNNTYNGFGYNPTNGKNDIPQTIWGEHIASDSPSNTGTYVPRTQSGRVQNGYDFLVVPHYDTKKYNYYGLKHDGLLETVRNDHFISDGAWHHITLNYVAPSEGSDTGQMTYTFDDKYAANGAPKKTQWTATENISLKDLDVTAEKPNVYWGFTGTTGAPASGETTNSGTENALVAFEQVPGQANVNATTDLKDEKTGDSADSTHPIGGNDRVKLTYKLNYESGENPWSEIKSSLNLPANIDWDQGQITYSDGSEGSTLNTSSISNNKLDVSVNALSDARKQAVITLEGKAKNVSAQDVANTTYFSGKNAIATATSNTFKINPRSFSMSIDKDSRNVNVNADTPAKITGTFSANDTKVTAENTKIAARLTSKDGTVTDIDSDKISIVKNGDGSYSFTIPVDKVPAGDTAVDVVATSSVSSGYTDEDTAKLHGGTVTFGATSGKIIFKKTVLTGKGTTISRDDSNGPWSLNVDSSLASGAWTLSARTTGMHSVNVPSQSLDGNLIYKNGDDVTTLNTVDSPIMTSPQSTGAPTETNIASDWTNDSGILLDVNGGAVSDDYIGEITWTLGSVPKVN